MKLISLGKIDEKFYLYIYVYIIIKALLSSVSFFLNYAKVSIKNVPLIILINNGSNIFFGIPAYFIRKANSKKIIKEKEVVNDNNKIEYLYNPPMKESNVKNVIILFFVILLDYIYISSLVIFQIKNNGQNVLVFNENLKFLILFFLFLICRIFDKKLFYRHQYISLIIILLSGFMRYFASIFNDENVSNNFEFSFLILTILFPFIDSIFFYSIQKFIKNKYYSPFSIMFLIGCIHSIISIILLISFYDPKKENSDDLKDLLTTRVNAKEFYIPLFIIFSFLYAYEFFAKIITINSFGVFHCILLIYFGDLISSLFDIFSNFILNNMITALITFLIEIFGCLVFVEIIELNFCRLNKNIKKNIAKRSIEETEAIYEIDEEKEKEDEDDLNRVLSSQSETNSEYQ